MRTRYLFIRILEACSADCFMCDFARSQDGYRFSLVDLEELLPQAQTMGVGYVRFTGGEPLLHKDIITFIRVGTDAGMKLSLITNGARLPGMISAMVEAGLAQVIVSIDGASPETHDRFRNTPGLFARCTEGLRKARDLGALTRVNAVVGPHNYAEMPLLQERLTALRVQQWELSAIKLGRPIVYSDPEDVHAVCERLYAADPGSHLVPMGKRFFGEAPEERMRFFNHGITPRAAPPHCNLIGDVIYIDAKAGLAYGCSLLPHRSAGESGGGVRVRTSEGWRLDSPEFREHVLHFHMAGPRECRGCSTTAAGYSDDVAKQIEIGAWHF
jgi:cytosylglucuronate decarboxylase